MTLNIKSTIATIAILALVGLGVGMGASAADVVATVTPQVVSVTVTDGSVDYGTLNVSESAHTNTAATPPGDAVGTQSIENTGNVSTDIVLRSSDAAKDGAPGVTDWALHATTIGSDVFVHSYEIGAGATPSWSGFPADGTFDNTNTGTVVNLPSNGSTATLDLKIDMPSSISETSVHSIDITVVATAA